MSKRINYIDVARGIGILLVVMGHNDFAAISPFMHKFIYSFHMPLFFFLGGLLRRPETFEPPGPYVLGRLRRILVPFYGLLSWPGGAECGQTQSDHPGLLSTVTCGRQVAEGSVGSLHAQTADHPQCDGPQPQTMGSVVAPRLTLNTVTQ